MIMFKLLTSKLSSIFTPAYQGITQILGDTISYTAGLVDTVATTAATVVAPMTDLLTQTPVIGSAIESTLTTTGNLLTGATSTLNSVGQHVAAGDITGAVDQLLDHATGVVGGALNDASGLVADVGSLVDPISGQPLSGVPILGDVLSAAGVTLDNASGLVNELGDYVAAIDPLDTLGQLTNNPFGTVGGVVQDVSGILDNILDDVSPVTDLVSSVPVVGHVSDGLGYVAQHTIDGLGFLGNHISQLSSFNPFDSSSWWT